MPKKKILIFFHSLEIDGAATALLGLLETIDTDRYETDLFLMRHAGELMPYIPGDIRLLPEIPEYASLAVPIGEVLRRSELKVALGRVIGKCKAKKRVRKLGITGENDVALEYSHIYTLRYMPQVSDTEYDLAISFINPHYFVTERVKARKKLAWIHTDYSKMKVDAASQLAMWEPYDVIASISDGVTEAFLQVFPSLKDKVRVIENILPEKYILRRSVEFSVEDEMPDVVIREADTAGEREAGRETDTAKERITGSATDWKFVPSYRTTKLLTIGRFSPQKKIEDIPEICRRLIGKGLNVTWYIIGYGGLEELIKQRIKEAGMEKHVIMLGAKENPYPYIRACDIYIQPSRYEGKSIAVREAQLLHKPVIITNYLTARDQLEDGVDGVIVPLDIEGCAEGIACVIEDEALRERLTENTRKRDYTNAGEVEKIYKLISEEAL